MDNFLDKAFGYASQELLYEDKASRTIKKVRRQAKKGKGDFKLNKEQEKFLKKLQRTYGETARKELEEFRVQTLAPLHFVQKKTRESGLVTTRDLMGLTKKEWERGVESGKNKIKKRGEISEKIKNDIKAIEHNRRTIQKLERIKRMISGKADINKNLVRSEVDKFIRNYNFLSTEKIADLKQVQQYSNDIKKSWENLEKEIKNSDSINLNNVSKSAENILDRQYNYRKPSSSADKEYDENLSKSVADFYLRQDIVKKILSSGDNVFKSFYSTFLTKLASDAKRRANSHADNLRKRGSGLEFNYIENKIWGVNKNAYSMSGDLEDYYLKIEEEDFDDRNKSKTIDQPEEMKQSKKKIENERYNFAQRFKKKYDISDIDFERLQSLDFLTFIDRDKLLRYAKNKLGKKMKEAKIKSSLDKIIYNSTNEKSAEKEIDRLSSKTIKKEDMYDKAYKLFNGELDKTSIDSIVNAIVKKSKTEAEAERRIVSAYNKVKEGDDTMDKFKKSVLGDE